jgi:LytR cell envelope-related transcriptional attenuator
MTTLSPTGSSRRRGAFPVVLAVVAALAIGIGAGWYFAGRDKGTTAAVSSTGPTCQSGSSSPGASTSTSPAASTAKSSSKPSSKPSAKPSTKPAVLPLPGAINVNVYNATTRKGLAKTTGVELAARGFRTAKVANDPAKKIIAASAEIRFGPAGAAAAKVVAAQVIGAVMVPDHRKDASVDFVLGEGFAALATTEQASAALAALASPSPTPC